MQTSHFRIVEHDIPATLIRENGNATVGKLDTLRLAVKQYQPLQPPRQRRRITIIGAHANGFPKELYEPLWDGIYADLQTRGIDVANVFIADVATQGASGELNERLLGDDPSWMDHPRDLFLMIHHFRSEMTPFIVGIGHSMGGNNLVNLSLMHPRLLSSLVLIDPVMQPEFDYRAVHTARLSSKRRDQWPSRQVAAELFQKSPFYAAWDPRVFQLWVQFGLRDVSQAPSHQGITPVTLRTTKKQEILSFVRPKPEIVNFSEDQPSQEQLVSLFDRTEIAGTHKRLPDVLPGALYIHGGQSPVSPANVIEARIQSTGTSPKGSGGMAKGRVENVTFSDVGHLIPMEHVARTAARASDWIARDMPYNEQTEEREAQLLGNKFYGHVESVLRGNSGSKKRGSNL